ncbi:hypothetical protein TNCV_724521 [Trichonephila clavipes]|nr:hypothetical protein TNCV_724521 [Trichonephila clavipes]
MQKKDVYFLSDPADALLKGSLCCTVPLSEFIGNPLVRNSTSSTPLASQKVVSMTFVADLQVSENQDNDILYNLGHNDESKMSKFRQRVQMDRQPTRIFLHERNEVVTISRREFTIYKSNKFSSF